MCKYKCYYKGRVVEVEAETSYSAQTKAAKHFKTEKKPWEVAVVLVEVNGEQRSELSSHYLY
jgi:hypothetical protein